MTVEQAHHPVFARIYTKVAALAEGRGGAEHRRKLLAGLSGRVIEVGAGSGANFAHYPTTVSEVVAVEPEGYLREHAQDAAANAPVAVSVLEGGADRLPGEEASFDAGVAALVLCTVPDQARALAELFRVIRPGGELRFYEHVISKRPWGGALSAIRRRDVLASPRRRVSSDARHERRDRTRWFRDRGVRALSIQPGAAAPGRSAHPRDGPAAGSYRERNLSEPRRGDFSCRRRVRHRAAGAARHLESAVRQVPL